MGGAAALGMIPLDQSQVFGFTQPLPAGTLNDVVIQGGSGNATLPRAWFADFLDLPSQAPFHDMVERVVRSGLSSGCGAGNYCPFSPVRRAQIAVLLLRAIHGTSYVPPSCSGVFVDVPCPGGFAVDWIEDFAAEGYSAGCGGGAYCPAAPVSRSQAAVLLLKASIGPTYVPPSCTGVFADVPCPSPFADWIEALYLKGITSGCGTNPLVFCPGVPVLRGQTAALLVKSFSLP
jgi:hypothetical protein